MLREVAKLLGTCYGETGVMDFRFWPYPFITERISACDGRALFYANKMNTQAVLLVYCYTVGEIKHNDEKINVDDIHRN